jgi:hypothetical protein
VAEGAYHRRTEGAYHRRIRLTAQPGIVLGELEDDFHHFRVRVAHDGIRVRSVEGEGVRFPWTTCPLAVAALAPLAGMTLSLRSTAVGDVVPARSNCTHMFDLAGLAVAHAARGGDVRQYDAVIPDRDGTRTRAALYRDGSRLLSWDVDLRMILGPEPFSGRLLRGRGREGFLAWAERELDADTAEAAIVLRRACDISHGRSQDLDAIDRAAELADVMSGSCFTFQPETWPVSLRVKGSIRDFTGREDELLSNDD